MGAGQDCRPGFINFFLAPGPPWPWCAEILEQQRDFRAAVGGGKRVQVEFVSAIPPTPCTSATGGAAYGTTVANLLAAVGFDVHREYYINDAGRQMEFYVLWFNKIRIKS